MNKLSERLHKFLIITGIFFLTTACTLSEDKNFTTLTGIIENEFNGPSDELKKIWDDWTSNSLEDNERAIQELESYYEKNYQPYVTDNYYNKFISADALVPLHSAYMTGYSLKSKDIEIKEDEATEDAYSFSVKVTYSKDGKDEGTADVKGRINLDKDGKISRFLYFDDGGLMEAMTTGN